MSKKEWTAEQQADIVRLYEGGKTGKELGELYGVSYPTIAKLLRVSGVTLRVGRQLALTEQQRCEIVELYRGGDSTEEIGHAYGVSKTAVNSLLRREGVVVRKPGKATGLSATQEREAVARYVKGEGSYEIASSLGVDNDTILGLVRRAGKKVRGKGNRSGLTKAQLQAKVAELYEQDLTSRAMAKLLRVSTRDISAAVKELGLKRKSKRLKLSEAQVVEAVKLYEGGEDYRALAKLYGVSTACIGDALKRAGARIRTGWSKYRVTPHVDRKGRRWLFKSSWEVAYAKKLDEEGKDWEYEQHSYPLGRRRKYTPDFFVLGPEGELLELVEVHGWLDDPTKERLELLAMQYPELPLEVLGPGEMVGMGLVEPWYADHRQAERVTAFRDKLASLKAA